MTAAAALLLGSLLLAAPAGGPKAPLSPWPSLPPVAAGLRGAEDLKSPGTTLLGATQLGREAVSVPVAAAGLPPPEAAHAAQPAAAAADVGLAALPWLGEVAAVDRVSARLPCSLCSLLPASPCCSLCCLALLAFAVSWRDLRLPWRSELPLCCCCCTLRLAALSRAMEVLVGEGSWSDTLVSAAPSTWGMRPGPGD
jgi:hypothetical protein